MKLQELIEKLNVIAKDHPETDMYFQMERYKGGLEFSGLPLHYYDVRAESGQKKCVLVLSDRPDGAEKYVEYLQIRDEQNSRLRR